jgi:hypothetical protein
VEKQKNSAAFVPKSVKLAAPSAASIKRSTARNVQQPAGNVQKNAGKWRRSQPACLLAF